MADFSRLLISEYNWLNGDPLVPTCPLTIISLSPGLLKSSLDLALAGQLLALYCTFSLDRSKPVTSVQSQA